LPDRLAGTRDLNGITIFVKSADAASLTVDGESIVQFTRNPPDDSGRESITIVDDNTPTAILGRLAPENSAQVTSTGGTYEWLSHPSVDRVGPSAFARLIADNKTATLTFSMKSLSVWNATHLSFLYRISRSDGRTPCVYRKLKLGRSDGEGRRGSGVNE
jgi:hypothetical protein